MPKPPLGQNTVLASQPAGAIKQARALRQEGRIGEAGALCQRVLKTDPRHVEALHLMGALALQTDAFDLAILSFNRALAERPRSPAILFDLGQALSADGRPAEAISAFRKALALRPGDAAIYIGLGDAQLDTGQTADALKSYRKARTLDPGNRLAAHMAAALSGENDVRAADYVPALFDAYAPTFEAHLAATLDYHVPERLMEAVQPHIPSGRFASALDLGCGTGLVGAAFGPVVDAVDGIDISPAMIQAARDKQIYRMLAAGDLVQTMRNDPAFVGPYQLVTAADVFIYIGRLEAVFATVRHRLAPQGLFTFSIEEADQDGVTIRSSGRFAHGQGYILDLARDHGLVLCENRAMTVRKERGRPIAGRLFVLRAE